MKRILRVICILAVLLPCSIHASIISDKYESFVDKTIPQFCSEPYIIDQEECKNSVALTLEDAYNAMVKDLNVSLQDNVDLMRSRRYYEGMFKSHIQDECKNFGDPAHSNLCNQFQLNYISIILNYFKDDSRLPGKRNIRKNYDLFVDKTVPQFCSKPYIIDRNKCDTSVVFNLAFAYKVLVRDWHESLKFNADRISSITYFEEIFKDHIEEECESFVDSGYSAACKNYQISYIATIRSYFKNDPSLPSPLPPPAQQQKAQTPPSLPKNTAPPSNAPQVFTFGSTQSSTKSTGGANFSEACNKCMKVIWDQCYLNLVGCETSCKASYFATDPGYGKCRLQCANTASTCKNGARSGCAGICN